MVALKASAAARHPEGAPDRPWLPVIRGALALAGAPKGRRSWTAGLPGRSGCDGAAPLEPAGPPELGSALPGGTEPSCGARGLAMPPLAPAAANGGFAPAGPRLRGRAPDDVAP